MATEESESNLFIIDATALCYRAFFALPRLLNSKGMPTGAIYGFVSMLTKFLGQEKPKYLAVCFDVSRDTFRQKKFADYKIQRPKMPDELVIQLAAIKKILSNYNISIFEYQGYEADDLIATISKKAAKEGFGVKILTADKDLLQLVSSGVNIIIPHKDKNILYDEKEVMNRFGVLPKSIPEVMALMGDAADNIPGVKGIGEKTAVSLIKEYDTVCDILKKMSSIKPQRVADLIKKDIDILKLSRELVKLDSNVPIDIDLKDLKLKTPNYKGLFDIYKELEFKSLLKELPVKNDDLSSLDVVVTKKYPIDLTKKDELIFNYVIDNNKYTFYILIDEKTVCQTDDAALLEPLFKDEGIKKAGFDLKQALKLGDGFHSKIKGQLFDVMIASYLVDSSKTDFSLQALIYDYLGLRVSALSAAKSLVLIARLKLILEEKLKENNLKALFYNIEMPLVRVLAKMEINGITLDLALINDLSKNIEKKIIILRDGIFSESGCEFNLNSPKQLSVILFDKLKLPVIKRGKTGPSTNEAVLKQLSKNEKIARLILEYRHLIKLKTGYIDALPGLVDKKTNRIHAYFNQVGTETGRLSMNDPNLQNIPIRTEIGSQLRKAFIPKDKKDFIISADYSQIELRILAHLSADKQLLEAFKNDQDVHSLTASFIYGLETKDITDKMRDVAKRINFSIIYGMSAYGLAQDLEIELEAAQNFIDTYFLKYEGVKEFISKQIQLAKDNGFVTTIMGRKRFIREINSPNKTLREFSERQAINSPIQGSSADLIKLAMINIDREFTQNNLKTKMILQIHDELLFETDKNEIEPVKTIIKEKMENVYSLTVPIKVDIKVGKNWFEA